MSHRIRARLWLIAVVVLGLAACGGGGGGKSSPTNNPPNTPPTGTSNWDSLRWDNDNWA